MVFAFLWILRQILPCSTGWPWTHCAASMPPFLERRWALKSGHLSFGPNELSGAFLSVEWWCLRIPLCCLQVQDHPRCDFISWGHSCTNKGGTPATDRLSLALCWVPAALRVKSLTPSFNPQHFTIWFYLVTGPLDTQFVQAKPHWNRTSSDPMWPSLSFWEETLDTEIQGWWWKETQERPHERHFSEKLAFPYLSLGFPAPNCEETHSLYTSVFCTQYFVRVA